MFKKYYTIKESAEYLDISLSYMYYLINHNVFYLHERRRKTYIHKSELDDYNKYKLKEK